MEPKMIRVYPVEGPAYIGKWSWEVDFSPGGTAGGAFFPTAIEAVSDLLRYLRAWHA